MKHLLILLLLTSCYNDDLECPNKIQLRKINAQLQLEYATMRRIEEQPFNDDTAEQISEQSGIIESFEIEKLLLENQPCH